MKQKLLFLIAILSLIVCHVHAQKFTQDVITLKRKYDAAIRKFGYSIIETPILTGKDKGHLFSVDVGGMN